MAEAALAVARPAAGRRGLSAATLLVGAALLGVLRFSPKHLPTVISVYWADMALLSAAVLWFLYVRRLAWTDELRWVANTGTWFLILITVAILGSSVFVSGVVPVEENLIQAARFTVYGCVLLFTSDLAIRSRVDWHRLATPVLLAAVGANVVVATVQLIDPPVLGAIAHSLWGDDKLRTLASGYPRVYGTFFNANWFGVFVAWGLTYTVASRHALAERPLRLGLLVAALLFLIIVSGSRTGILASATGVAVSAMLLWRPGRGERRPVRASAVIAALVVVALLIAAAVMAIRRLDLDRFVRRFTELATLLAMSGDAEIATLDARMTAWQNAFDMFRSAPVFGIGGSTATSGVAPHNGYLAMLMNFGIVGAAGLTVFVAGVCLLAWTRLRHDASGRRLRSWFFGFTAALSVAMLAGDFVYTSRLVFLWLLIVALVAGQASLTRSGRGSYGNERGIRDG